MVQQPEAAFDGELHEPNVIRATLARWSTENSGSGPNHERNSLGGRWKIQAKSGLPGLDTASRRLPDVFVHLELKPDLEIVLQDPIDKLARFELIEHRGEQNRKAIGEAIFLDSFFRPEIILASSDNELDFVMRLKFVQIAIEIVLAFAAAGAFQVDDLDDLWVYPPNVQAPASFE